MDKKTKGKRAEHLAKIHYEKKSYKIVASNYRHSTAEIDIIAQKENMMVFVEVKMRSRTDFGMPESFVSTSQQDRIINAAEAYIFETDWKHQIRFDIVSINAQFELSIFEDAFH